MMMMMFLAASADPSVKWLHTVHVGIQKLIVPPSATLKAPNARTISNNCTIQSQLEYILLRSNTVALLHVWIVDLGHLNVYFIVKA